MLTVLVSELAIGALYAATGLAYNIMFSTSKVLSVTTGHICMLGGVFGAYFMLDLGLPAPVALVGAVLVGAAFGLLTEVIAIRHVLARSDEHLWLLNTLALATMVQQAVGLWWGTEPRPFPRLADQDFTAGVLDQKYWLPIAAVVAMALGLTLTLYGFIALAVGGLGSNVSVLVGGVALGLPSLRLPGFYFAMATMAFALIMAELSLAQGGLTGGGAGLPVPGFAAPFDTPTGFYWLVLLVAALITWMTWNVARLIWGRGLIALRDSEVAAAAVGVPIFRLKLTVFTFSGVTAGIGGALFASLQSYITPETFVFELGLFFFVCIIIGGRGSILGPFVGTVVLTALPEMVAPLAKLGNFFYGLLLLAVVLVVPEGIGHVIKSVMVRLQKKGPEPKGLQPDIGRLAAAVRRGMEQDIQRGHAS